MNDGTIEAHGVTVDVVEHLGTLREATWAKAQEFPPASELWRCWTAASGLLRLASDQIRLARTYEAPREG